ncbi:hypothetical protein ACETK8_02920 [Brevundimonas staleyi]|uniref:Uncharacterized protein n=1 Tax=Brevundimonas staleyi TaxID=74326 RepID=A0ABW0FT93_9CAUL
MRRFLIWSALAVVIGLALAGAGYWAYWNFYARFQPVTISRNQAEIQRLLDEASWVSGGGGGEPLYVIGYRDSASTQRYEREEAEKLRAGGVELRSIVFARADREGQVQSTPAERATVAELWLSRDWSLYERWTATPSRNWTAAGIPAADGNLARSAVVEASRQFTTRLNDLLRDAGAPTGYPLVIWRDRDGFMKVCACADSRSWAFIRDDFSAPDAVAPSPVPETGPAIPPGQPVSGDGTPESLPYPSLGPIPPAGQAIPPASGATQPGAAPSTTPSRPATPRAPSQPVAPPQPTQQEDTTFF